MAQGGLTRLDYELATAPCMPEPTARLSQHQLRAARAARKSYCQRYFWTGPAEEARMGGAILGQACMPLDCPV